MKDNFSPKGTSKRSRKTKKKVILIDKLSTVGITFGGVLVIVAVLGIMVFLTTVVVPLFQGAEVKAFTTYKLPLTDTDLLFAELDEYQSMGMVLSRDGTLMAFHAPTGEKIFEEKVIASGAEITAFSRTLRGGHTALGLANGDISLGNVSFVFSFLQEEEVPENFENLKAGAPVIFEKGVLERMPEGRFRKVEVKVEFASPAKMGTDEIPVVLIDYQLLGGQREVVAGLQADGQLFLNRVQRKKNLVTGKVTTSLDKREIPYEPMPDLPTKLLLNSQGDQLYLAWKDGTLHRYDLRNLEKPVVAEKTNIVQRGMMDDGQRTLRLSSEPVPSLSKEQATDNGQRTLSQLKFMIGDQSLVSADSSGEVIAWFRVEKGSQARGSDGYELVPVHILEKHRSAVSTLAVSPRDKGLVTATSDGEIFLRHMTSEQVLLRLLVPSGGVLLAQVAPKTDGIFAVDNSLNAYLWRIYNPHPETTLQTIFGKVWYEGYPEPTYTWQSSSGTDDFEPKFSLIPLAFGTFKATLYSMLFAVPIAILAAIYTSEFLDKRLKPVIKPGIEMMASLPSVVLGFIAALVLAPFVENWVLAVLFAFGMVPVILLLSGYLWQLLPQKIALRFSGAPQLVVVAVVVFVAFSLADDVSLLVEDKVFNGDFKAWLDGQTGTGTPLWFALFLPFSLLSVFLFQKKYLDPTLREKTFHAGRLILGLIETAKVLAILSASALLSYLVGWFFTALGFDARSELVGTYVQRNTLVVGFAMGFAVIPIIYTITEDALSSVPESLRAASLACGATQWQTARWVIIPTAASGIFSAVMVGLGRAVGETMIVVMAAGNTPVMDINIFNGLRALSANIAVELPEAVKDGTLYRMLFLAALLLFGMTFIVNTIAEIIRLRFRKRAYQL